MLRRAESLPTIAGLDSGTRAAALVRLARVLQKGGRRDEALEVYSELEKLGAIAVSGQPGT